MLVVQTFSGENIRFNLYAIIGWGKYEKYDKPFHPDLAGKNASHCQYPLKK